MVSSSCGASKNKREGSGTCEKKNPSQGGEFIKNGKRYIRIIERDCVRDLLIPSHKGNVERLVFCKDEFFKFKESSKVTSSADKIEKARESKAEREKKNEESILRKKVLERFPVDKNYGPILTQLDEEASEKARYLLERVRDVKREQSDEVKTCNTIILGKKCQAIRDAQIAEKKVLEQALAKEERRLEKMMEEERALREWEEEMRKKRENEKRIAFREELLQQIRDNELQREIVAERTEEEQRLINEAALQVQIDCLEERRRKAKHQTKIREEMNLINSEILKQLEESRRESTLLALRVQECIRIKEEEEERKEMEKIKRKKEKERELAKVSDFQQLILDKKAERDAMEAKRIQEEVEKKWRAKEKESREERKRKWEDLKFGRERQAEEKKIAEAAEIEEEKREKERAKAMEEAAKAFEIMLNQEKQVIAMRYRQDLLKQMNEKEKERIKERKQIFEDGILLQIEEKARKDDLKDAMLKKVAEIRTHNIPETYIKDVEKKLQLK